MIRVILTDIEGTTTSIAFVHEVLFPYATEHLPEFVREQQDNPEVSAQLDLVAAESATDRSDTEALIAVLQEWIREDRKAAPLKALQGMVWEQGYQQGEFKSHLYDDAAQYLQQWHDRGLRLYVYSSGSEKAQKLIFGFTEAGDYTPFFSGYFDTRVGGKKEPESYRKILLELGVDGRTVLFLSDVEAELEAAEKAGLQTAWLVREGDQPGNQQPSGRMVARTFDDVDVLLQRR